MRVQRGDVVLAVKCEHLVTVATADINRVIGGLPPAMMAQVDTCLKVALAIP
jgi:mRNA-degrading endonuclease toxin of MazEF toxin-antitoxin module